MLKQEIISHSNLIAFKQHGFTPSSVSGENQVVGNCIFCNGKSKNHKEGSFFINVESKMWDCKLCGKEGGYKTFITELIEQGKENFKGTDALWLAKNRGLKTKTLIDNNVGYNPLMNHYIVPAIDINGKEIYSLKIFSWSKNGTKHRSITAGMSTACLGWEKLSKPFNVCYILEGEWDYFTWYEMSKSINFSLDTIFISLPQATGFKDDYVNYFKNKDVKALLHNDYDRQVGNKMVFGAGIQGMIKIYNKLSQVASRLNFIYWPEDKKDGYDVRDLYNDFDNNARKTFDFIDNNLQKYPPKIKLPSSDKQKLINKPIIQISQIPLNQRYTGSGIDCIDVYNIYEKWLLLPSTDLIDVSIGCVIGNRLPGDPIWLQLVGPSGCAKSVICMALDCHFDIEAIDTLTPATLISGSTTAGGGDPSLLPKLHGRILDIKDLTTIYEMNSVARNEIFGIFRSAFDGHYSKPFGNGMMTRSGNSKFGFIAGVTHAIEQYTEGDTALGTRFLLYKIQYGNVHNILKQIDKNLDEEFLNNKSMKAELKDAFKRAIDFNYNIQSIELDDKILEQLRYLSIIIEMTRGTVLQDHFTKEITYSPMTALPTRSYVQLRKELTGIMLFRKVNVPDKESMKIICDIASGTIPLSREKILSILWKARLKGEEKIELGMLSKILKLPSITCQRQIDKLVALGTVEKINLSSIKTAYKLTEQIIEAIEKGEMYSK